MTPQAGAPGCERDVGPGTEGRGEKPARSTARIPVTKMPSNVPAPSIDATGAPTPLQIAEIE